MEENRYPEEEVGHRLSRRSFLKVVLGTSSMALLTACASSPSSSPAAAPTTAPGGQAAPAAAAPTAQPAAKPAAAPAANTFVFGRGGDTVKLDPAVVTDGESQRVTSQIYDTLLMFEGQTTNVKPGLAESWKVSDDGKVWTFKLRQGVKFHDGTPLDAEAVAFNFNRWMDAKHPYHKGGDFSYWGAMFGGFKNDPQSESANVVDSVQAVDPTTFQVNLKRPMAPFLNNAAMWCFAIASPTAIKKDVDNYFKNPVGSGAFKFVEWVPDDHITVEANKDYWGEKPKLDRVIWRVIKDNTARFMELRAGTIHGMEGINPDDIKTAKSDPNLQVLMRPSMNVGYLAFNFKNEYLAKKEARQAIAYATNRQGIIDALFGGIGQLASQFLPPSVWGYNPNIKPYPYDPDKAKALLKQAGCPDGFSIDLWYMPVSRPYYPDPKPIAEAFAADLAKVGIKANLKTEDWSLYTVDRRKGKFPFWMLGWIGDNGDPDNFLNYLFGTLNDENSWDNPEVRSMLAKAQTLNDKSERTKIYQDVAVIMSDEMPRLPVVNTTPPLVFRKNVKGYLPHPTGAEFFNTVSFQ